MNLIFFLIILAFLCHNIDAATKDKRHGHNGVLESYNGKQIPFTVTNEQSSRLEKGLSVTFNERIGKSGRGVVIQDINATEPICMEKIRDLLSYPKMVPHVNKVKIYNEVKYSNGTSKTSADFEVGLMGLKFRYFLLLTHEPKFNTLTWTLDYQYNSDFDDNVGHWQVMPHPHKKGWSRVLYSTKVKLFSWIPEFVVSFLTSKALVESTTWVKRESELEAARRGSLNSSKSPYWTINGGEFLKIKLRKIKDEVDFEINSYKKKFQVYMPIRLRLSK